MRANEMIYCHMIMHGMELIGVDDTKNSKLISILEKVSSIKKLKKSVSSTLASWASRLDQSIRIMLESRNWEGEGVHLAFVMCGGFMIVRAQ
jgi:hypothetical protein